MTYRRDLFYEIVASADFQAAMVGPMIDDFVQKMKRPGADGATYRGFIEDWLYLQRPLFDRFQGVRYNVQFEGPPLIIDQREYPPWRIHRAPARMGQARPHRGPRTAPAPARSRRRDRGRLDRRTTDAVPAFDCPEAFQGSCCGGRCGSRSDPRLRRLPEFQNGRRSMSKAGFKQKPEKGCDATHRASFSVTHQTRPRGAGFRHFRGGRCARSLRLAAKNLAFAPFRERANGALGAVRP